MPCSGGRGGGHIAGDSADSWGGSLQQGSKVLVTGDERFLHSVVQKHSKLEQGIQKYHYDSVGQLAVVVEQRDFQDSEPLVHLQFSSGAWGLFPLQCVSDASEQVLFGGSTAMVE